MASVTLFRSCLRISQGSALKYQQTKVIRFAISSTITRARPIHTSSFALAAVSDKGPPASGHWKTEKIVSVGILAALPAGFFFPGAIVNYALAFLVPPHIYWGFAAIVEDYAPRPIRAIAHGAVAIVSVMTCIGLLYFNYSDVGICKAVAMLWQMKTS